MSPIPEEARSILICRERNFLMIAHRARTDDQFNINDLCGSAGRLDGVLRAINSALFLSHGMRRDTSFHALLLGPPDPPKLLSVDGLTVRYLNPDERSTAALVKRAMSLQLSTVIGSNVRSTPGIIVMRIDLVSILDTLQGPVYLLDEGGDDIMDAMIEGPLPALDSPTYFLLSDDRDLTPEESGEIARKANRVISISPKVLHADHSITILHNFLDRSTGSKCPKG